MKTFFTRNKEKWLTLAAQDAVVPFCDTLSENKSMWDTKDPKHSKISLKGVARQEDISGCSYHVASHALLACIRQEQSNAEAKYQSTLLQCFNLSFMAL